jgi:hypothetical protein
MTGCVEGTFVNDNSLGSQPAATGLLTNQVLVFTGKNLILPEDG